MNPTAHSLLQPVMNYTSPSLSHILPVTTNLKRPVGATCGLPCDDRCVQEGITFRCECNPGRVLQSDGISCRGNEYKHRGLSQYNSRLCRTEWQCMSTTIVDLLHVLALSASTTHTRLQNICTYTHTSHMHTHPSGILLNAGAPCRNSYNTTHNQFNYSPTHPLNYSPTHPLNYSPTNPLNYSATNSLNYSPINPLNHSATNPLNYSPTNPLNYSATNSLNHSPTHPLNHSPTHPLNHSATNPLNYPATNNPPNHSTSHNSPIYSTPNNLPNCCTTDRPAVYYLSDCCTTNHPAPHNPFNHFTTNHSTPYN